MKIQWKRYPAGADAFLFQKTMRVTITKGGKGWDAWLDIAKDGGGGALYVVEGAESVDAAINGFESWLSGCISELLGSTLVWENECGLVVNEMDKGRYKTGEMGLYEPKEDREIQVCISSWDRSGDHPVFGKLEGVPVRISIERVPGGRM